MLSTGMYYSLAGSELCPISNYFWKILELLPKEHRDEPGTSAQLVLIVLHLHTTKIMKALLRHLIALPSVPVWD
jgi:hypothetical protein